LRRRLDDSTKPRRELVVDCKSFADARLSIWSPDVAGTVNQIQHSLLNRRGLPTSIAPASLPGSQKGAAISHLLHLSRRQSGLPFFQTQSQNFESSDRGLGQGSRRRSPWCRSFRSVPFSL
jgi:hypothetical protein